MSNPLSEDAIEILFDALGDFGTNSPEANPGVPHIADLIEAVAPAVERIVAARVDAARAEERARAERLCGSCRHSDPRDSQRGQCRRPDCDCDAANWMENPQ